MFAPYPETLKSLRVPTAVVWGTKGSVLPLGAGAKTAALIDDPELVLLDGVGHFLPEQRPEEVAQAIRDLVARSTPMLEADR